MNGLVRVINRLMLAAVGLILLVAGILTLGTVFFPAVARALRHVFDRMASRFDGGSASLPLPGTDHSVLWLAVITCCILLIALCTLVIVAQRSGRTNTLVTAGTAHRDAPHAGTVVVDIAVAEQVLADWLTVVPEVVSVQASAVRVHGSTVLKVSVAARKGATAHHVAGVTEDALESWSDALGAAIPTIIEIVSGLRTRLGSPIRVR